METQVQTPGEGTEAEGILPITDAQLAELAAPMAGALTARAPESTPVVVVPELTHELAGELVRKLTEIEAAKPELIGKLRAEREKIESDLSAGIAKLKAEATERSAAITKALHALGWRRPRTKPEGASAPTKTTKKRGRPKKAGAAAKPSGEVAPVGTEN